MAVVLSPSLLAQPYAQPDCDQLGDEMIKTYLDAETERVEGEFPSAITSAAEWSEARPRFRQEYLEMLGLWPLPERTPLRATVTGTVQRGDYTVDLLHYQSRPGLYVTANLYRPTHVETGQRLPAILYACGHADRSRNGNKTAYQSNGIWFARHGYVCLIVDTLQLGEVAGRHHGTYRDGRWSWLSRGYTPAGVECWNGIRGLDYLTTRSDVDVDRLGVTGISGGGATTFWVAAADERVKAAVPVSGMADLHSYISDRVVNGHCDCMFLYNTHQWPWTRIAGLIAPRSLLFVNSDRDSLFPMDANKRVINRLERLYSLSGAGDRVDSLVSVGGHDYRPDIRQAAFRFFNTHLKNDPAPVLDSEVDLVGAHDQSHPIPPAQLRVFPQDSDLPADALNARIDHEFVPVAQGETPTAQNFDSWREDLLARLRRESFHHFPQRIPAATLAEETASSHAFQLVTEPGITIRLRALRSCADPVRIVLAISAGDGESDPPPWLDGVITEGDTVYVCEPRGVGSTSWTRTNPPNYVERAHYLLGRTVDSGRVWDIAAAARYLKARHHGKIAVQLVGGKNAAVLAIYAALLENDIEAVTLRDPPATHKDDSAPALLGVLRVCDIPEAMGMLAPRRLNLFTAQAGAFEKTAWIYRSAAAVDEFVVRP